MVLYLTKAYTVKYISIIISKSLYVLFINVLHNIKWLITSEEHLVKRKCWRTSSDLKLLKIFSTL